LTTHSELYTKITNIINSKEYDKNIVQREMDLMEKYDVLSDIFVLYQQSQAEGCWWDDNPHNSMVAYLLEITSKKPDGEFKLDKRRTYGRAGFPDIDIDFDHSRRHEIVEYLIEKYGRDHVGNIGTIGTLQIKAAVRRAIKATDPEDSIVFDSDGNKIKDDASENFRLQNEVLNTLPKDLIRADSTHIKNINEAIDEFPEFGRYMKLYPDVYRYATNLEGNLASYGCVAADTGVKTNKGQVRIDEVDLSVKVAYVDKTGKTKYTSNFYAHKTGTKKCYKMRLISGDWIKVTDEHLIFTDKGCILFEKIRKNPENYKVYMVKE